MPLNEKQQQAFDMALSSRIGIITGAPGTGKTFTLKAILEAVREKHWSACLMAPTGKAAKQMQKSTGAPASTIHRALEPAKNLTGGFIFRKNEDNLIDANMVVVDEMSMVTNDLMADLLRAVDVGKTRLLFVGDHYQLPSVGSGAVLRDFIASQIVPCVELTEIQRNSGDIVRACHRIKDGDNYLTSPKLDPAEGFNFRHIEAASPWEIQQIIKDVVCKRMPAREYNPVWDIQVLSPVNKKTDLSCKALNKMLQKQLNPNPRINENVKFRVADKVIQTKNEIIKDATGRDEYVVNGDMGEIVKIEYSEKRMAVKFSDPDRIVNIPPFDHHLLLAYCITVHRAQGSEFPVVVIPLHQSLIYVMNRNWLYTAISRAQDICITVGQIGVARRAIRTEMTDSRMTLLKQKLRGEI